MPPSNDQDASLLFDSGEQAVPRPVVRLFTHYARPHIHLIAIGTAGALVSPLAFLVPIYLVETVIDAVLLDNRRFALPLIPGEVLPVDAFGQLIIIAGIMVGLALVGAGAAWSGAWAWGRFAQAVQHEIRSDTYETVQGLSLSFFANQQSGQLLSILNDDVQQLESLLENFLPRSIETVARFGAIVGLLLLLNWQLALILIAMIPILAGIARYFVVRLRPKYWEVRQRVGALHARIQNAIAGIATIKAYTRESYELGRVKQSSRNVRDRRWAVVRTRAKFYPSMTAANWIGFGVLLMLGGYWILHGPPLFFTRSLQVGTLVTFMLFSQQFMTPLVQAAHLVDEYFDSRASAIRIFALHDQKVEGDTATGRHSTEPVTGHLSVEQLSFAYDDGRPVLRDVSFDIEPGSFVAIVGPTGSGKTTLVELLLRFFEPTAGTIRIDGCDIRDVKVQYLRQQFSIVPQDPHLFTGSIRENIAYGRLDAPDAAVREAAVIANAHEFIDSLPKKYETQVGERGIKLSGGQQQRIAIARAILSEAPILILDEAMSHLDAETEATIRARLRPLLADRTTIAIAHRLETISGADRIIVLDEGNVHETGTHEELLARKGLYAELWWEQSGGKKVVHR